MATPKEEFMKAIPADNIDFAAQQIINCFSDDQFLELQACFNVLDEALFKSWSKDMTFNELLSAVKKVASLSNIQ